MSVGCHRMQGNHILLIRYWEVKDMDLLRSCTHLNRVRDPAKSCRLQENYLHVAETTQITRNMAETKFLAKTTTPSFPKGGVFYSKAFLQ